MNSTTNIQYLKDSANIAKRFSNNGLSEVSTKELKIALKVIDNCTLSAAQKMSFLQSNPSINGYESLSTETNKIFAEIIRSNKKSRYFGFNSESARKTENKLSFLGEILEQIIEKKRIMDEGERVYLEPIENNRKMRYLKDTANIKKRFNSRGLMGKLLVREGSTKELKIALEVINDCTLSAAQKMSFLQCNHSINGYESLSTETSKIFAEMFRSNKKSRYFGFKSESTRKTENKLSFFGEMIGYLKNYL